MSEEFNEGFPEDWPRRITAMKIVTYDVEIIREQLLSDNRASDGEIEITFDDILEAIYAQATDDFSCGWGHTANISDLALVDENGEEY